MLRAGRETLEPDSHEVVQGGIENLIACDAGRSVDGAVEVAVTAALVACCSPKSDPNMLAERTMR